MEQISLITNCLTSYATVGETVTYNIICTNTSNTEFEDIFLCSNLNSNLRFIPDSVKINYIEKPNLDISSGISIGYLDVSSKCIISFDAKIISKKNSKIDIITSAECIYKLNSETKSSIVNSTCVVFVSNPSIYISKSSDKEKAFLNDIITYTIKIINNGDLFLDRIILKDDTYKNLEIIEDSFKINSKNINNFSLEKGVDIGSLNVNDCIIIEYQCVVTGKCLSCNLKNNTFVEYNYCLDNGLVKKRQSDIINCDLSVSLPSFKQICIEEYINLPKFKEDIGSIEYINTDVIIKNYHTIKTPVAISNEGISLSGNKLIIHGSIEQVIRYCIKDSKNSIHSFEHEMPFSTFIILPIDYQLGSKVHIDTSIEHIHYNLVNTRRFFESLNILISAKTLKL